MPEPNTDRLTLALDRADSGYVPGETITGLVRWAMPGPLERIDVRLFWRTEGKGSADSGLAGELTFDRLPATGEVSVVFDGPPGPYSFSGTLVSVVWAVEAIAHPGKDVARVDFVLSPTGREVSV